MSQLRIKKNSIRKSFGRIKDTIAVPNLIEIQSLSFNDFIQLDFLPDERRSIGLHKVLQGIFPIAYNDKMSLEYVSYELGNWACTCGKLSGIDNRYQWSCSACKKSGLSRLNQNLQCPYCKKDTAQYQACSSCLSRVVVKLPMSFDECHENGQTFSMPLRIKIQLVSWVGQEEDRVIHDIKEQDIFFADVPVMVDLYEEDGRFKLGSSGTFLINGVDRVIVSQLHRSPGVVFSQSKRSKDFRGQPYLLARIIPMRGSWIDFEFDSSGCLYVRIDKKKKFLFTAFLQALGFSRDSIISLFYDCESIYVEKGACFKKVDDGLIGFRIEKGAFPARLEEKYLGKRVTRDIVDVLKKMKIERVTVNLANFAGRFIGRDFVDSDTGEVIIEQGVALTEDHLELIKGCKKAQLHFIVSSGYNLQPAIPLTLAHDKCFTQNEALKEIHLRVWPGDSASLADIKKRLENLFCSSRLYDLTRVGRIRMNRKLGITAPEDVFVLTKEDILATARYLIGLRERGEGELDDIDHLGNRRVRLVGELLTNQIYLGFLRIERIVRERFRMQEPHSALMPQDFLNVKPLGAVLREFFGLGQLSQFMDQTNPLAEIAHKRRLSALGPGGVLKDRATYEIRDVHNSHYGRICPIETPEGQTIGLISSLATYAMVNDLGFIETAYRPVKNGIIQDNVVFLDAFEELNHFIAQTETIAKEKVNSLEEGKVLVRNQGNYLHVENNKVDYIDLSPKQLVSVSSALIPFLEHDDATRALMGANMQRQAIPLVKPQAPIVGTGMEYHIGVASGAPIISRRSGVVEYVSAKKIIVCADSDQFRNDSDWVASAIDIYHLRKFGRSSYSTWLHQSPIVKRGDHVRVGDVLSDGSATDSAELALGTNLRVAFMPWRGYNFEDAIVLNQRLVAEDVLTSVHIDEYMVDARDTKLGPEEITADIPDVGESILAGLDEDGIVRPGTRVKAGNILVGKVTLKGDVQFSPEEKLLRAIFGEKSREVRDTSLRVPPGVEGVVIDVKIFSRSGIRKDERYKKEVLKQSEKIGIDFNDHEAFLQKMIIKKMVNLFSDKKAAKGVAQKFLVKGVFSRVKIEKLDIKQLSALKAVDSSVDKQVKQLGALFENQSKILAGLKEARISRLKKGDPLPSGVIKMVKVYIAMKRHISAGDKLAGRHGNKGVVSTIVPPEDMPYMSDGTQVDIILNPLGIPSRMNVGQILESMLGLAGQELGRRLTVLLETEGHQVIKKFLQEAYGFELINAYYKEYGKEGLMQLAQKSAKSGIKFGTPIFDGATLETDIKPLLNKLGLPKSSAFRLSDGYTGEYFKQLVTVGTIYMMKLNHMVEDKLHARSVGPYSLVTQQPLGGKAQLGGQRLGEMEVWALEAYGAAYVLQEMLTYKSDDVIGRHKVYDAIIRCEEELPVPGVPESFNVLIKELQSLGLQIDLLKSGKESVSE